MPRPTHDRVYMDMALLIATRGTCKRRQVGCVLVDEKGRVLSMGYNGVPSGWDHCTNHPCPGAHFPSGEGLSKCQAIHAEQNAVLLLEDPQKVHTAYVTVTPCDHCVKLLLGTSTKRIVTLEFYPHADARKMWEKNGGVIEILK